MSYHHDDNADYYYKHVRNYDPSAAWMLLVTWFDEHVSGSCKNNHSLFICYSALNNSLSRLHYQSANNKLKMVYQCFTTDQLRQLKIWLTTLSFSKPSTYELGQAAIDSVKCAFDEIKRLLVIL